MGIESFSLYFLFIKMKIISVKKSVHKEKYGRIFERSDIMKFYIKNSDNILQATCRFSKETKLLTLERSSLVHKTYVCKKCDAVEKLRTTLIQQRKLKDHNEETYLLMEEIEFSDINSAVCLVLGSDVYQAEKIIENEFGETLTDVYEGELT